MKNYFKNFFVRWRKTKIVIIVLFSILLISFLSFKIGCSFVVIPESTSQAQSEIAVPSDIDGYQRTEESTYLTYPEWHIVYSSEEYANWLEKSKPSGFPYFSSIGQFWSSYCTVYKITGRQYGFNLGNHFMLWVIGTSFTVENAVKGVYENIVGRITEWISSNEQTDEDLFAYQMNKDYVTFIYDYPWYEFSFAKKFGDLWTDTNFWGPNILRKWERKAILSLELGVKTVYGGLIKLGTRALYGKAPTEVYARISNISDDIFVKNPLVKNVKLNDDDSYLVKIPRYRLFTEIVPKLASSGVQFIDIAGNDEIFLTAIAPGDWEYNLDSGDILFKMKILTQLDSQRIAIKAPIKSLSSILNSLNTNGVKIEHLYDY